MPHIALIGDSIFDNQAYLDGGPDVVTLLADMLPEHWGASLHAVDGAVAADVPAQLKNLPPSCSHLVLSVGGNNALAHLPLLNISVASSAEALLLLDEALEAFEHSYRKTLACVLQTGLPFTVCTIYNANFDNTTQARCVRLAVALFNDVILRAAREHSLPSIDLRLVCTAREDYANEIEPSVLGGIKIGLAIMQALQLTPRPTN